MKLSSINRLSLLGLSVLVITMTEASGTEKPTLDHPCPTFMTESVNCNPETAKTIHREAEAKIDSISEEDMARFPDLAPAPLQYEPTVVEIHGVLKSGKHEHPNGELFDFYIIQLHRPVSIEADEENEFNVAESDVKEIQVFSGSPAIREKMAGLVDKNITAKGTVFHEHTAWHVRALIMDVQELNQE